MSSSSGMPSFIELLFPDPDTTEKMPKLSFLATVFLAVQSDEPRIGDVSMRGTDCFTNLTIQERLDLHLVNGYLVTTDNAAQVEYIFRTYFGYAMLPFAILANIVTVLYITVVFKAILTRRVSRKCYILLLNRAVSDLLSSLVGIGVCLYVLLSNNISRDFVILIESVFIGSFWTAMVSYVALSVIKLLCVWRPLRHKQYFTMRRCFQVIIFSWLVYVIMVGYAAGATALVRVPALTEWSGCRIETCLRQMYRIRHVITIAVYCSTLVVFFTTVVAIKRGQRQSIKIHRDSKNSDTSKETRSMRLKRQFPLWKLTLNIANFAILQLLYVLWCIFRLNHADKCFLLQHFWELLHTMAIVKFTLVLRIIIDPILSFITDTQLRRCLYAQLGIKQEKRKGEHSSSSMGKTTKTVIQPTRVSSLNIKPDHPPERSRTPKNRNSEREHFCRLLEHHVSFDLA